MRCTNNNNDYSYTFFFKYFSTSPLWWNFIVLDQILKILLKQAEWVRIEKSLIIAIEFKTHKRTGSNTQSLNRKISQNCLNRKFNEILVLNRKSLKIDTESTNQANPNLNGKFTRNPHLIDSSIRNRIWIEKSLKLKSESKNLIIIES